MKTRRRTILIDKRFQYRLVIKFIALNFLIMLVFGFFMYLFLNSEIESNLHSAHVTFKNIKDMLFPIILTLSVINLAISSIVIYMYVLFASHKIAGPLYRFNEALNEMKDKNLRPMTQLRKDDQLLECSIALEGLSDQLTEDFSHMSEKLEDIKKLSESGNAKEIKFKVTELDVILSQYRFK